MRCSKSHNGVMGLDDHDWEGLRRMASASALVLGEDHPATLALARAVTAWTEADLRRAWQQLGQLDRPAQAGIVDISRLALGP